MRILVCIKQVPDTDKVNVDPETGVLQRSGLKARMNPYDEYAIETALYISGRTGAEILALSMGTPDSEAVLREAFSFGVHKAALLSDRALAGADVLATSAMRCPRRSKRSGPSISSFAGGRPPTAIPRRSARRWRNSSTYRM